MRSLIARSESSFRSPPAAPATRWRACVGDELGKQLGGAVVVENRPGSGGIIGTDAVASSIPDGHTLLHTSPSHVAQRRAARQAALRPAEGLRLDRAHRGHLAGAARQPGRAGGEREGADRAGEEAVAELRLGRQRLRDAHEHGAAQVAGAVDLVHVPYKGSTQARTDLLSGQIQLTVDGLLPNLPHIRAGKLKAIAVDRTRAARRPRPRSRPWPKPACQATSPTPGTPCSRPRRRRGRCCIGCAPPTDGRAESAGLREKFVAAGRRAGRRRRRRARRADARRPRALAQGRRRREAEGGLSVKRVLIVDPIAAAGEALLARSVEVVRSPDSDPATIRRLARRGATASSPAASCPTTCSRPRRACAPSPSTAPAPTWCRSPTPPRAA